MNRLLGSLARLARRRAAGTGSREWVFFSVVFALLAWVRKRASAPQKALHREVLQPGESVRIEVLESPGSKGR